MAIVKLNKKRYVSRLYGKGIYGKYSRILTQNGRGIVNSLGQSATKMVLGSIGKNSGSYAGKQLGRLIQQKTGSKLLGSVAKSALSSLGGLAGSKIGDTAGKLLGETVFKEEPKKKPKVSLSELLQQAKEKIAPQLGAAQAGQGIRLVGAPRY